MNHISRQAYRHLIAVVEALPPAPTAAAHPCDEASLAGVLDAAARGIIDPILAGPKHKIAAVADAAASGVQQ